MQANGTEFGPASRVGSDSVSCFDETTETSVVTSTRQDVDGPRRVDFRANESARGSRSRRTRCRRIARDCC
ncbi:MAG TPA: hypothetical protein DCQ98_10535 [Planctomycetaceae bacterium]|nr:hypothetical protein [Planctomycetaceae bacterium]